MKVVQARVRAGVMGEVREGEGGLALAITHPLMFVVKQGRKVILKCSRGSVEGEVSGKTRRNSTSNPYP